MKEPNARSVVIVSGSKNFHLLPAAAEADKRHLLSMLFCGVYPKRNVLAFWRKCGLGCFATKANKFAGRRVEVDEDRIHCALLAEALENVALSLGEKLPTLRRLALWLQALSMRIFAWQTARTLRRVQEPIALLHYRAGFGLASLSAAKEKGAFLLCDHSIVHPLVLETLIEDGGTLKRSVERKTLDPLWALVQRDIDHADHILVNSDFVKQTFVELGSDPAKISVIYLGVDDAFLSGIPERRPREPLAPCRFLFAGAFCERKGARTLLDALYNLPPTGWALSLAGSVAPSLAADLQKAERDLPVRHLGNLDRATLARLMTETDVFVFPSLAEGSARVVFEALACGCFVITTPNTGSIVQNDKQGYLVAPGDAPQLLDAMKAAIQDPSLADKGAANAQEIRKTYTQKAYGDALAALYRKVTLS